MGAERRKERVREGSRGEPCPPLSLFHHPSVQSIKLSKTYSCHTVSLHLPEYSSYLSPESLLCTSEVSLHNLPRPPASGWVRCPLWPPQGRLNHSVLSTSVHIYVPITHRTVSAQDRKYHIKIMSPHNLCWEVNPFFLISGSLSKIGTFYFNVWKNSTSLEPSGSGIFFMGKF